MLLSVFASKKTAGGKAGLEDKDKQRKYDNEWNGWENEDQRFHSLGLSILEIIDVAQLVDGIPQSSLRRKPVCDWTKRVNMSLRAGATLGLQCVLRDWCAPSSLSPLLRPQSRQSNFILFYQSSQSVIFCCHQIHWIRSICLKSPKFIQSQI